MLVDKLDYVLAVAEEQNLTRAAQRLYVSQPALSLYLNRLEAELDVKLFDRTKSPILLTPAGQFYVEQMKKLYASEQHLRNDIQSIANPRQTLNIGIGQVRGHHWLPTILPLFCARHPNLNIHILQATEDNMVEQLRSNHMDVAFGALPSSLSDFAIHTFDGFSESLVLAAHRRYQLIPPDIRGQYNANHPYLIEPEALRGLPTIEPNICNGLYESIQFVKLSADLRPSRTITVNNMSTGLYLAVCGLGVQLLYCSILQQNTVPDIDQLDFVTLEKMPVNRRCVAAYREDSIKVDLINEVIEIVEHEVLPYINSDIRYLSSM